MAQNSGLLDFQNMFSAFSCQYFISKFLILMVLALKMYSDNTNGLLYHLFKEKCQNEAYKIGMSAVSAIENIFWEVF